jgi:tetratricopeptide (TPR) repeat protein
MPPDRPDRPAIMADLAISLQARFRRAGALRDLDRAITLGEQVVDATPPEHRDRPEFLSILAVALATRFERTGALGDLDRAITLGQEVIEATPVDHRDRPGYLTILANALRVRFQRTGALTDLDWAITLGHDAIGVAPADQEIRPTILTNLVAALIARYWRTGALADLNQAIAVGQDAVDATPSHHRDRAGCLSNLANALRERYRSTGALGDLDRSIALGQDAVDATPPDHPYRPAFLANLAIALHDRYRRSKAPADLDRAITLDQNAVDATPPDHPERTARLSNLGIGMLARYKLAGELADLDQAIDAFKEASAIVSAPADRRASAARRWGGAAVRAKRYIEAVDGFSAAVELMGLVVPRGLGRADQEFRLEQLAGLGSEAAAACLQAEHRTLTDRAVELFEQGRAILFSQLLVARSGLTDLQAAHPELADRFVRYRNVLDYSGPSETFIDSGASTWAAALEAQRRQRAAAEFEQVVREIRAQPGFQRFLRPRPVAELLSAAAQGPVVLLNVAALRSDALILTPHRVEVLNLPGVHPAAVAEQANTLLSALATVTDPTAHPRARQALSEVLAWLGDYITSPVLDRLGYTANPATEGVWPRVWWCPSGPLALLPIHAAGHHHPVDGPSDAVIDRVISSTVPTVAALLHARHSATPTEQPALLVVAMPETDDQPKLPATVIETATLSQLWPGHVDILGLRDTPPATFDTVMTALPSHACVHFACHAESDIDDPSDSHLLLTDYHTRPLTVAHLTRAHLQGAELAFLSACTTARSGRTLPDEPINLAAACQLAGYRHVVGSLWPISDTLTAWLTEQFYSTLLAPRTQTATGPAAALHHASRDLRASYGLHPHLWAPYTHIGP